MKHQIILQVLEGATSFLDEEKLKLLNALLHDKFKEVEIIPLPAVEEVSRKRNAELVQAFLSAKSIEGCSEKTIRYYQTTIEQALSAIDKSLADTTTNDIRCYLATRQAEGSLSKVTVDNYYCPLNLMAWTKIRADHPFG